jgi:hypothetical protein
MLFEERFGCGENPCSSPAVQSIKRPRHQRKARIAAKKLAMLVDETPVEAVDHVAPWTLFDAKA